MQHSKQFISLFTDYVCLCHHFGQCTWLDKRMSMLNCVFHTHNIQTYKHIHVQTDASKFLDWGGQLPHHVAGAFGFTKLAKHVGWQNPSVRRQNPSVRAEKGPKRRPRWTERRPRPVPGTDWPFGRTGSCFGRSRVAIRVFR